MDNVATKGCTTFVLIIFYAVANRTRHDDDIDLHRFSVCCEPRGGMHEYVDDAIH